MSMNTAMGNAAVGVIPTWTLGDRLRKARESAGYEQLAFAEATGIARATISAAERGHRRPIKSNLRVWAMATGVPLTWLETGEGPSDDGPSGKLLHLDSNQEPIGFTRLRPVVELTFARAA